LLFSGRFLRRTQGFASSFGRLGQRRSTLHVVQDRGPPLGQSDTADKTNASVLKYLHGVFRKVCIPNVLSSVLSNSVVDTYFLYNLLLTCDPNDSMKFTLNGLRMYKRQPSKFRCISETRLRLLEHHRLTTGKSEMTNVVVTVKWWKKFEMKKFDYDTFFKFKADERFVFVPKSDFMDLKRAKEYCEDHGLDSNSSYRYLLMKLFQNWRRDWNVTGEASCGEERRKRVDGEVPRGNESDRQAAGVQHAKDRVGHRQHLPPRGFHRDTQHLDRDRPQRG
jgi:hypothetical protein